MTPTNLSSEIPESAALYFLQGGGNDLRDIVALTDPNAQIAASYQAASNMALSVYALYNSGARNFMITNAPNIGLIPELLSSGRFFSGSASSIYFNYSLDPLLDPLRQLPEFQINEFDVYGLYNNLLVDTITGGAQYGFITITPCINTQATCNISVFFDDIHPTARAHAILGNAVADQILGLNALSMSRAPTELSSLAGLPDRPSGRRYCREPGTFHRRHSIHRRGVRDRADPQARQTPLACSSGGHGPH